MEQTGPERSVHRLIRIYGLNTETAMPLPLAEEIKTLRIFPT